MTEHLTDEDLEALTEASFRGGSKAWRAEIERILTERVADRLAAAEALGQDGSPGSLMEDIRAELTALTGDPGIASACNTRVMHQVREHLRAALHPDSSST
jgi:hypothetical protein